MPNMKNKISQVNSIAEAVLGVLSEASNPELIKKLETLKAQINNLIDNTTFGPNYQIMGNKAGDFINEYIVPAIEALKKGQDAKEALKDFLSMGSWYGSKTYLGSRNVKDLVYSLKQTLGEPLEANVTYSFTKDEYDTNYKQYTSGKMSKDEWIKYTTALLNKIMEVNKDVLVRLKNR